MAMAVWNPLDPDSDLEDPEYRAEWLKRLADENTAELRPEIRPPASSTIPDIATLRVRQWLPFKFHIANMLERLAAWLRGAA